MGIFLKVIGGVILVVGIILTLTVLGAVIGVPMLVNGVTLFALGAIYDGINEIKSKIKG